MRAFIAVKLPDDIREGLKTAQDKLKSSGADVKWVEPQNIHLTLKFLGEIDEAQQEKICAIIEAVAKENNAYQLSINSAGAFPKIESPRVVWVGALQGAKETKAIAEALEERIRELSIPKEERAFASHITLGRTRSGKNIKELSEALKNLDADLNGRNLEFSVGKITLYKSTLTPNGPVYEILQEASLKTS